MVTITPLAGYLSVTLEPDAPASAIILTPPTDQPVRWATVQAIGPQVRDLQPGQRVAISLNQAIQCGPSLVLPSSAVLLTTN